MWLLLKTFNSSPYLLEHILHSLGWQRLIPGFLPLSSTVPHNLLFSSALFTEVTFLAPSSSGTSEVLSSLRAAAPANSLCLPVFIHLYPCCIGLSINGASSEFSLKPSLYGYSLLFSIFPHSFPPGFAVICIMFLLYLAIVFLHRTKLNEGENCNYHVFLSA